MKKAENQEKVWTTIMSLIEITSAFYVWWKHFPRHKFILWLIFQFWMIEKLNKWNFSLETSLPKILCISIILSNKALNVYILAKLVLVIVWLWGQFGKNSPRFILTFFKIARTQWGWFEKRQNETRVYFFQIARKVILFRINRMIDNSLGQKFLRDNIPVNTTLTW